MPHIRIQTISLLYGKRRAEGRYIFKTFKMALPATEYVEQAGSDFNNKYDT